MVVKLADWFEVGRFGGSSWTIAAQSIGARNSIDMVLPQVELAG